MVEFALALAAFLAAHVVPRATGLRDRLAGRFGERRFRLAYSALSLALLAWVVSAALAAPHVVLWAPGQWAYWIPVVVMPVSLVLLMAGFVSPNPLSIGLRTRGYSPERPGIVAVTRHPLLWGFGLWAASHIPANGDAVTAILFASMALFAFAGMAGVERRTRRNLGEAEWRWLAAPTAMVPGLPLRLRASTWLDANAVLGTALGVVLYAALLTGLHHWAIGADPLAGL